MPGLKNRIEKLFAAAQQRLRRHKPDEAATLYLEVIALPDIGDEEPLALESAHLSLADIYLKSQKIELAEFHLTKALGISPKEADIHRKLGELYGYKGQFDDAAREFLRAVDLVPHHPEYLHRLGWATFMAGDQKKGRKIMEESLFRDESNTGLLGDLAMAAFELGDHRAALKYLDQAVELDPKNELLISQRERMREKAEKKRKK
ncbi:MAG: tetratricopeptide repeat protein [Candidatus Edwardsbacteria bacterium]|nr:tetratricopeptide repeat protein [Candidatus Edwardsbacteria bacterium]